MKLDHLFEFDMTQTQAGFAPEPELEKEIATELELERPKYEVREIDRHDTETLKLFCDMVNKNTGQLVSLKLTPQKLIMKMGILGSIWGMYPIGSTELVGGVAVKQKPIVHMSGAEIGYLFLVPEHRSLKNVVLLYKAALDNARRFDVVYLTTNVRNRSVNRLLSRTPRMKYAFTAKNPKMKTVLHYWISVFSNKRHTEEERIAALKTEFGGDNEVNAPI
jgi:hypothetical protein